LHYGQYIDQLIENGYKQSKGLIMIFNVENMAKVPFSDMNLVHSEELELANSIHEYLISTKDHDHEKILTMLEEFTFHIRDHFLFEEDMMRETSCPILDCHASEHKRVQKIMYQLFLEYGKTKNINLLIFYFEVEFKTWIENHIITMDTVTGAFLENPEKYLAQLDNSSHC
jgi:hemerythrin